MNLINGLTSKSAALADARQKALHRFVINGQEFLVTPSRPGEGIPAEEICGFAVAGSQCYLLKVGACHEEPEIRDSLPPHLRPPASQGSPPDDHHGPPKETPVSPMPPLSPSLGSEVASRLTARELQIAALVAMGHSNKQIHRELGISEWTVCSHLRRIFIKLGVDSRAAMVFLCANILIQKSSGDPVN